MVMPGFSSPRMPVQARLFLAISASLALTPVLTPEVGAIVDGLAPAKLAALIVSETIIGAVIGLMGRFFFLALQFMATAAATAIGFGGIPGGMAEDTEPAMAPATLFTLTATVLFFLADLHLEVIGALIETYAVIPPGEGLDSDTVLRRIADSVSAAFLVSLQVCAPFFVYSLVVNFLVGIANKLTPQIPVYFISMPFVLAGGMLLMYAAMREGLRLFMTAFIAWLAKG